MQTSRASTTATRRLAAFTRERFLPVAQLVLVSVMYTAGVFTATVMGPPAESGLSIGPLAAGLALTVLAFFHLRLMDDVKDADHDRMHEPDRPIPRGLVSEAEVDRLTALVIVIEFALALAIGPVTLLAWGALTAYTLLMRVEFFASDYLDKHVMVFAASHTVSMAFLWAMLVAIGWEAADVSAAATDLVTVDGIWWMYAMAAAIALAFEMGRKTERYVAAHRATAVLVWALLAPVAIVCAAIGTDGLVPAWTTATLWLLVSVAAVAHAAVLQRVVKAETWTPPLPARSGLELAPALTGLALFAVLAIGGVVA